MTRPYMRPVDRDDIDFKHERARAAMCKAAFDCVKIAASADLSTLAHRMQWRAQIERAQATLDRFEFLDRQMQERAESKVHRAQETSFNAS